MPAGALPTVTNIVRASSAAQYRNNSNPVTFTVTVINDPTVALTNGDFNFTIQNGTISSVTRTASGTYSVTIQPVSGAFATTVAGVEVKITGTTGSGMGTFAPTTNQDYNIRTAFLATATKTPAHGSTTAGTTGAITLGFSETGVTGSNCVVNLNGANITLSGSATSLTGSYSGLTASTSYVVTFVSSTNVQDR